jgi:hypothetical protein
MRIFQKVGIHLCGALVDNHAKFELLVRMGKHPVYLHEFLDGVLHRHLVAGPSASDAGEWRVRAWILRIERNPGAALRTSDLDVPKVGEVERGLLYHR